LGGARIVDPGGDALASTGTEPGLALARVDVAGIVTRARRAMAPLRDLRPDLYRRADPLAA
jgi:predicted amidohydrolase